MTQQDAGLKIRGSRQAIIDRWAEVARNEIPAAKGKDRPALQDSLPDFLDNVADALEGTQNWQKYWTDERLGLEHGRQRFDISGYSLKQVLAEYRILRQVIFETLLEDFPENAQVLFIVNDVLDRGLANAGDGFAAAERESDRRAKERFVAGVSHDLRNPIASARLATEALLAGLSLPDNLRDCGAILGRNLDQAELLIRDLLDVNRVHFGQRLPINPVSMELGALVRDVLKDFGSLYGSKFDVDVPGPVWGYWCRNGIRRLLDNLLSNAVKYGASSRPISIKIVQDATSASILVHNFGHAIAPAAQATVFEPFVRYESGGAEAEGWGLGLAIVKAVAEAHGGAVSVSSAAESGTTFSVILPNDSRPFQEKKFDLAPSSESGARLDGNVDRPSTH